MESRDAQRFPEGEERDSWRDEGFHGGTFEATRSPVFQAALTRARLFAADPHVHILLMGETGTGKTILARHLHAGSPRAPSPFVHLNLATQTEDLSLSEILGHRKGAFTGATENRKGAFERGDRGTVFLDEIAKCPLDTQKHLLHVIDTGEVQPVGADRVERTDCRIIAASNVSLEDERTAGRFLDDLLARIETFRVSLPPLRERPEDIPALVIGYLERCWRARPLSARPPTVHPDLMRGLVRAPWPHNLRQLHAAVQLLYLLAKGARELTTELCDGDLAYLRAEGRLLNSYSRRELEELLRRHRTVTAVAEELGFHRGSVHARLRALGIVGGRRSAADDVEGAEA